MGRSIDGPIDDRLASRAHRGRGGHGVRSLACEPVSAGAAATRDRRSSRAWSRRSWSESSGMSRPVHRLNAAAVWWSSIASPLSVSRRAGRPRVAQQPRVARHVHQVEHQQIRREQLARNRRIVAASDTAEALMSTLVLASSASMTDSCQGIARSSMCDAERPKWRISPSAAVEVAVEDDHALEALGDQRVDGGPGATAGADDDGRLGHLLLADQRVERGAEADHVRVVADQPASPRA